MPAVVFTVDGDPVPQPRPRITVRGRHGHAYVPKDHAIHAYRQAVALAARAAGASVHEEPASVVIDFVFARPKSHMRKNGLAANAPRLPRPDIDNLEKAVLDALKGVAWKDDTQVARVVKEKSWGTEGRTTVRIT
jgi:Holliday junction resolvase RusA-like endonuclease